jgi:site-specific DNA-methyltransferase (adenine-specific)
MKLYNDDCLKILPTIPDKSIDLILTDPPYGTTQCKWDNIIPFEPMWKELKRIIKDNSCIALFGTEPFSSHLRLSNLSCFKYDWIWQKSKATNYLNAKKQPLRDSEIISIFYDRQSKYYAQMEKGEPYNKGYGLRNTDVYSKQKPTLVKNEDGLRYPKTIQYFKTAESEGNVLHPTQKPISLLEYLIKTYTDENDTVLDFAIGSGSTAVACKNLNRKFIGIEIDKQYFEIAKNRIESTLF